ncbi:hypothetical protein ACMU_03855 [Actibacterium mucosum KCTC 23349]|uniref:Type II secretion system protein GspE N-terminal domain-containing protein n=1 Tax=Actibacterium mucosum KCTC 23349 TaxID=1454373 RepID=A0A037ZFB4_9RHOB|nr:glycosyltransferase [Actibacterium mucosum]KAJ54231.1 hypothetical protein ACMU_03855 [Actibacterium mucosum KCTC 23349]
MGDILVEAGELAPEDLVTALALQQRQDLRLGDILVAHGMTRPGAITQALAEQYNALPADLKQLPPDPRLIDEMGAEACLALAAVPIRKLGGATIVATARPDEFRKLQLAMPQKFGTAILAIADEKSIHAAIVAARNRKMTRKAETRVAECDSCRFWYAKGPRRQLFAFFVAVLTAVVMAPVTMMFTLLAWGMLTLILSTMIKVAAAIVSWRAAANETRAAEGATKALRLPVVSVMVPLFREEDIAARLIKRLERLDYPKELLDVCLVTEEDDLQTAETLARTALPGWMRVITVPVGSLKTKPRAMNFALNFCRGSIVGIYDAEDAPAPDQIHRVVRRFHACGPDVACLQGALDFYNTGKNWFSRCFTIEYAAWFRVILPGIAKLGLAVPLGGTTLFFRRHVLEEVGGWDAHNVTEDADLGIRLARRGYRTEVISTVTQEEANCRLWPWVKQRSRWLKGYAMTWSTHMQNPVQLYRELGARKFWGFQVMFLGTLSQFVLVPLLWSCWLLAFGLPHPLGSSMPGWMFPVIGATFLATEVVTILIGMMGSTLAGKRRLRWWVPTLHFYYPLAAIATYKALIEMVIKPFYWDKTLHGVADDEEPVEA